MASSTGASARAANLGLGLWLHISAFVWPHGDEARLSAWLPGLLISIVALLSMSSPPMRRLNAALGLWAAVWAAVAAGSDRLTYWNGVVVGVLVLTFSLIPSRSLASDYVDDA
jgi:hypothetical protein